MKKPIVDIVEDFFNQIPLEFPILSSNVDIINNITTISVSDTMYLKELLEVEINGQMYVISGVDPILNILTFNTIIPSPSTIIFPKLKYFHGTVYATNSSLSRIENWRDKFPMLYLKEIIKEVIAERLSVLDRRVELRMFFLDSANFADWTTNDFYQNRINGMRSFLEHFIEQMRNYYLFDELPEYEIINHIKFGEFQDNKGSIHSVFDEELTGLELKINLPILKQTNSCY